MSSVNKVKVETDIYDISPSPSGTLDTTTANNKFESSDVAQGSATSWTNVDPLAATETNKSIFTKITQMIKNVRYLCNIIGTGFSTSNTIKKAIDGKAASNHTHNSVKDAGNNSSDVTFAYSKAGIDYGNYSWLAGWNGYELRAVNKGQFATAGHTHTKSQITDFPASLKNPTALTIQTNGTTAAIYDGSAAKTVNITKGNIGLGNVDNTADANKSVKYATSAGSANTATKAATADNAVMASVSKGVQLFTSTRPTSMNFNLGSADYNKKITYSIATSITKEGKPPLDSLVTTYAWDDAGWGAQLAISSDSNPRMYVRGSGNNGGNSVWDANWKTIAYSDDAMTPKPHTHNYAGSSSAGGSANSAVKLDSSAGSNSQPVYFSGGKPVAIGYTIASSVPANAKFTDTTYGVATASSNGLMSSTDKTKLDDFSRVISIQKQIKLTTDWQDTGIAGNNLETGTYIIQVSGFNSSYTSLYNEIYSGIMTWYASETNSDNSSEIFLHNAGHADNSNAIYLRTSRRSYGNGGLHLQIACKVAASGTDTLTFKFRRLI